MSNFFAVLGDFLTCLCPLCFIGRDIGYGIAYNQGLSNNALRINALPHVSN